MFKCKAPSGEAKKADCVKEVIYRPMPFYHFAFYVANKVRPLCPVRRTTFEECLDRRKSFRKIVSAALVPAATALFVVLFHKLLLPFVLVSAFYVLWAIYQSKTAAPVCIHRVWNKAARMLEAGNLALLGAYIYVAIATVSELNPQFFISIALMTFAALSGFSIYAWLEPHKPHGVDFPRTGARGGHGEYRRFLEDLADAWKVQDMCGGWLPYEHYNKLRALVCRGDAKVAEKVSENWPLIFAAYYLMFHKRDIETAQKVLDLVKSRSLDEKDKAALEVLEAAYGAVANPPCGSTEALLEKISGVQTYGWASLLKALVAAHFTCDPDYKDDVKRALLQAAVKCRCDNLSICYFTYRMLNRINLLYSCPV